MSENDDDSWGKTIGKSVTRFFGDVVDGGKEGITERSAKSKTTPSKGAVARTQTIPGPNGETLTVQHDDKPKAKKEFQRQAEPEVEESNFLMDLVKDNWGKGLVGLLGAYLAYSMSDSWGGGVKNALFGALAGVVVAAVVKNVAPGLIPGMGGDEPNTPELA